MSRWEPGARERLESAAFELFLEQGFAATTVPDIASRAGLTTRTFFRYYADKREVLFKSDDTMAAMAAAMMAQAPDGFTPGEIIARGLETLAATAFRDQFEYMTKRRKVIESDEGLRERELLKRDAMAMAVADNFRANGIDDLSSKIAGRIAIAVFSTAVEQWIDANGKRPLVDFVRDALEAAATVKERGRRAQTPSDQWGG